MFTTSVVVKLSGESIFKSIYKEISECLASYISAKLSTQVTLSFNDSEQAYRAYENGRIIIDLSDP